MKIGRVLLSENLSNHIRLHRGSNEEVLEKLNSFGISKDMVPGFWGGSLEFTDNLTEISCFSENVKLLCVRSSIPCSWWFYL